MHRTRLAGFVLAVLLLAPGLGAHRLAVRADEIPPPEESADQLWLRLDRCRAELTTQVEPRAESDPGRLYVCSQIAERLAEASAQADSARAFDLFDVLPAEDPLREALLRGLLAGRLKEVTREMAPAVATSALGVPLPPVPDHLAEAKIALQKAWQVTEALGLAHRRRLQALQKTGKEASSFKHGTEFQGAIADFLRGRASASETVGILGRFVWGSWCGTGSESFFGPQSQTLLLAFLALGDREAAAGALLAGAWSGRWSGGGASMGEMEREILAGLGFDWEEIFLGRLLGGDLPAARTLASHGSDRAARLLFEARTLPMYEEGALIGSEDTYLHALAALVTPTDRCSSYGTSSSLDLRRGEEAEPIGADLEAEILDLLASQVAPGAGQREAETAAHLLVRACRSESLPAFLDMARSPYSDVRGAGAIALRALGEKTPPPRANRPVAFDFVVDGARLTERKLQWELARATESHRSMHESSSATTTDGTLHLERDPFLDPKDVVEKVTLSTGDMSSPGELWFSVELPRPTNLDAPVSIRVATQSLTLVCPEATRDIVHDPSTDTDVDPEAEALALSLHAATSRWGGHEMFFPIFTDLKIGNAESITFPRLQRGRYQLLLLGAAGVWHSDELVLGRQPLVVRCGPIVPFEHNAEAVAALRF